ncbi:MAG: T9SS type A sorting domain-containing protein, partial [Lentimicrobiaceae bacterium]|nr:T9SS type A sorting domain-containing protein [Lentimicrobiaceae bacterium]
IPRIIDGFDSAGVYEFFIEATFMHPTCNPVISNILTFNVVENPKWDNVSITPNDQIYLGQEIHLQAEIQQNSINAGVIQWQYSIDDGALIDLPVGGNIIHTPQVVGSYTYMLTYIPDKPATGCMLAPFMSSPISVILSINEHEIHSFLRVAPNPANEYVEVRMGIAGQAHNDGAVHIIEFYNAYGQLVKRVPYHSETKDNIVTQRISITDLSKGIYLVKVGNKAVKLVVQ